MAVRNHIHLSSTLGGAPENAPDTRWKTVQRGGRVEVSHTFKTVRYSLSGTVRPNVLKSGGTPVRRTDYQLRLLVRDYDGVSVADRIEALKAMEGTFVKFVDHDHPADGEDHTDFVKDMFFESLSPIPDDHPTLDFFVLDITLLDATGAV